MADFTMFKELPDSTVLYDGPGEFVFIIPELFFESRCAIVTGEFINLLGVANYYTEIDGKKSELRAFYAPTIFLTQPYTMEKIRNIKLTKNTDNADYRLLRYRKGDKIMVQARVPQLIENVEEFFRLFMINGHIPETIPYNEIDEYFRDAISISGNSYGVHEQMIGMLPTETCRDPEDPSKPFRISKAKKNKDWKNYKNIAINEVPDYVSPFVELTSERWDDSLITASMMKDSDIKYSPLEKVLYQKK